MMFNNFKQLAFRRNHNVIVHYIEYTSD